MRIQLLGQEVQMVVRACKCPRCRRTFKVSVNSPQIVCSIDCFEITTGIVYIKSNPHHRALLKGLGVTSKKPKKPKVEKASHTFRPQKRVNLADKEQFKREAKERSKLYLATIAD